jgi:hypothetical protein
MFQGTELKHQNSKAQLVRRTSVGETVDKVEALTQFFGNEKNEIEVENLEMISYRMMKGV